MPRPIYSGKLWGSLVKQSHTMQQIQMLTLNDGTRMPALAFGTGTAHTGKECSDALVLALQRGIRSLDSSHGSQNESSIKTALEKWGGKREDVFICSKWGWSREDKLQDPEAQLRHSLEQMGVDYIDLYLIHLPNPRPYSNIEAWKKMEEFKERGLVRSIGISNFQRDHIEDLAKMWTVKPSVNQVEYQPYTFHDPRMIDTVQTCQKYGIVISPFTVLSPLKRYSGGPVDEVVNRIGDSKGITSSQVLLAWARQQSGGGTIVTTASKEWQYQQILDSANIELSEGDMEAVRRAGREGGLRSQYTLYTWDHTVDDVATG